MSWTADELTELISLLRKRGRDTPDVEVKAAQGGTPRLGETLSAFGNMPDGGTIILGLAEEEQEFAVLGIADPGATAADVAAQARKAVEPPVQISTQEAVVDGRTLLVVTVLPSAPGTGPYLFRHQAYLRQADGDYRMSRPEVQQLMARQDRPRHDSVAVPDATRADLDDDLVDAYVKQWRRTSPRMAALGETEILVRTRVLEKTGTTPTIAGLYALGVWPQEFLPSLSITAAVETDPRSGQRNRDLVHLSGSLPNLLADAVDWVDRVTGRAVQFSQDGHGRDRPSLPLVAVRELVANALVHRDLSPHTMGKRVEIRLTPSDLVITNPGGLWGVTTDQLGTPGGKSAVNEFLYDIAKNVQLPDGTRIIEGEGGGIRESQRLLRAASLRPARFIDGAVRFTCLIPRHALITRAEWEWLSSIEPTGALSSIQRHILVSMRNGDTWTNSRVRDEYAPIDSVDARAALQGLVGLGLAVMDGTRGSAEYRLAPSAEDSQPDQSVNLEISVQESETASGNHLQGAPLGDRILAALGEEPMMGIRSLAERLDAPLSSVRAAMRSLRKNGVVTMKGGRGRSDTTYALAPRPED